MTRRLVIVGLVEGACQRPNRRPRSPGEGQVFRINGGREQRRSDLHNVAALRHNIGRVGNVTPKMANGC
jgi:hypothetical protein